MMGWLIVFIGLVVMDNGKDWRLDLVGLGFCLVGLGYQLIHAHLTKDDG